jgi:hypothetical protein
VDAPLLKYTQGGGISEQNMLSSQTSQTLLRLLNPIMIFSGHDHEGCICNHLPSGSQECTDFFGWPLSKINSIKEVTVRSIMADHSGAFGLLRVDEENNEIHFESYGFLFHILVWIIVVYDLLYVAVIFIALCFKKNEKSLLNNKKID